MLTACPVRLNETIDRITPKIFCYGMGYIQNAICVSARGHVWAQEP